MGSSIMPPLRTCNTGASISASIGIVGGWLGGGGVEWGDSGKLVSELEYDFVELDDLKCLDGAFPGVYFHGERRDLNASKLVDVEDRVALRRRLRGSTEQRSGRRARSQSLDARGGRALGAPGLFLF